MTQTNSNPASLTNTLLDGADIAPLFTPFTLSGLELSNRFVMAPMTRGFSPGGVPGADVVEYYRRRASHLGLIVTEGTYIDHQSAGSSDRAGPAATGSTSEFGIVIAQRLVSRFAPAATRASILLLGE